MSRFPFKPKVFFLVLLVVMSLVAAVFALVFWLTGVTDTKDMIGASISAAVFSYLVHLFMLPQDPHE